MSENTLHITNGEILTKYLQKLNFEGDMLSWDEMLCEGPTVKDVTSAKFLDLRKAFFKNTYGFDYKEDEFISEIHRLDHINTYKRVVLWFEYDLFCHINLIAIISLIMQKKAIIPLYLVCSGRIDNEKVLKGLSQLTPQLLKEHYTNKIRLTVDDISLAEKAWSIYCGNNHNLLIPLIVRPSNFIYLSNCLKAHLRRFADTRSGLNTLEYNILKLINTHTINSRHHLSGYVLHYQGFYGYSDLQIERIVNSLESFYTETKDELILNRDGYLLIEHQKNVFNTIDTDMEYGGVRKCEFTYFKDQNKLIKTTLNAH
ncbi:DUF1835 domain-containing protein [Bizionia gelidisalsuginis]|uniref:DUF1835 domain-containing protein n=1 Tax=Bizionia gelidisalsuginis TaxID=291188 RepID=A0ABY3MBJ6_9FLAO|nr:DUF1835 domain-containing protein [Bizionia gelidisalsuginis]TYC14174.1 DUF1835 domain-containing protein [Bizionia gelidisalsuginis]